MSEVKKTFSFHFLVIAMVFTLIAIVTWMIFFAFDWLFFATAGIAVACLIASAIFYRQSKPAKAKKIDIFHEGSSATFE